MKSQNRRACTARIAEIAQAMPTRNGNSPEIRISGQTTAKARIGQRAASPHWRARTMAKTVVDTVPAG